MDDGPAVSDGLDSAKPDSYDVTPRCPACLLSESKLCLIAQQRDSPDKPVQPRLV
jgi:hypothetical protein